MKNLKLVTLAVLIVILSLPLAAQGTWADGPIESMSVNASQITWQPRAGKGWVDVTVTGPGEYAFSASFPPGQLPIFRALDPDGNPLPDGTYNYEIAERPGNPKNRPDNDPQGLPTKDVGRAPLFETQSGTFSVLGGSIVDPNVQENPTSGKGTTTVTTNATTPESEITTLDQVINDDLIVTNSACIGFDCVNGENFGFDTIRLKENNLRIKFLDTSTGTFPSTDWELTANDSSNGGANRFSITDITGNRTPFTIEANAPSNSLYVDDGGRVGLGTSTPSVEVHTVDGDTPTMRLQQDGSSGFTPQIWDVAGNETNFFVRDVTNGSKLPFRIRPTAPDNSIYINTNGDIGLGTASPSQKLHILGSDNPRVLIQDNVDNANDKPGFLLRSPAAANGGDWAFEVDNAGNFQIDYTLSAGPEMVFSDSTDGNSTVTVNGNLVVNGTCTGCDGVFQEGFELESIEEHASFMWANSFLPGVGPTPDGKTGLDVFSKTVGILQELEKAHIYIEELHRDKIRLENEMAQMKLMLQQILDEK